MHSLAKTIVASVLGLVALAGSTQASGFAFERVFIGKSIAKGKFSAINGVRRQFDVDLTGRWNGRVFTLREDFTFSDGERDTKTWRFTKTSPTTYEGTREDVVGKTLVKIDGRTARFTYLVYLDKQKTNKVRFHDTMTLQADGTVKNTAFVTKFGFPVAITRVNFSRR
jgi:hypothetical protein